MGYFLGQVRAQKLFWRLLIYTNNIYSVVFPLQSLQLQIMFFDAQTDRQTDIRTHRSSYPELKKHIAHLQTKKESKLGQAYSFIKGNKGFGIK